MSKSISILLLHSDAEARLLADAEAAIQSMFVNCKVEITKQWAPHPSQLNIDKSSTLGSLAQKNQVVPGADVLELLEQPHDLVIFSLFASTIMPTLQNKSNWIFLAHSGLRATWSTEIAARVATDFSEQPALSPAAAAQALEPTIERLLAKGTAVAVCTTFRHVNITPENHSGKSVADIRELIRRSNLEAYRLSQRTGCFVLDLDRPLAQEGGALLQANCFGGDNRATEIALDELAALLLDAIPEEFITLEIP